MKTLIKLMKWDLLLLHRNRLLIITSLLIVTYIGTFHLLKSLGDISMVLITIIFNDPITTGFVFGGVLMLFDKQQNTLQALTILPIHSKHYLISKSTLLSLLAVIMTFIIVFFTHGADFQGIHLFFGTLLTTFIFSFFGFTIGSITSSFNQFILYAVLPLVTMSLPFLPLFEVGSRWWFCFLPSFGGIELIYASLLGSEDSLIIAAYINLSVWAIVSWLLVSKITKNYWS